MIEGRGSESGNRSISVFILKKYQSNSETNAL